MITITKEWLQQKIADMETTRDEIPFGLDEDDSNTLAALRIALASLEADGDSEPVAFINGAWTLVYYRPPKELGLKIGDKLYAAPPAPVSVPDEMYWQNAPVEGSTRAAAYATGWNACRAAMLQGADDNSPVIPDWQAKAEKMAEIHGSSFVVFRNGKSPQCADPKKVIISFTNEGLGHGSAAPQQEVKP